MRLSQLLKVTDRDTTVIIADYMNVGIDKKILYEGKPKGIHRDSPLNKGHVQYLMPVNDDTVLVEISLTGGDG